MYVISLTQSWFDAVGIKSLTMFGYVGNPCVESVEPILVHDPQLHATDTRIESPYFVDKLKCEVLPGGSCQNGILIVFVIGLLTHTKDPSQYILWRILRAGLLLFGASFFSYWNAELLLCDIYHRVIGISTKFFFLKLPLQTGYLFLKHSIVAGF